VLRAGGGSGGAAEFEFHLAVSLPVGGGGWQ
jgi:hypothetical protein